VKSFGNAKERLAPALNREERSSLARSLAEGVLRAVASANVAVVCDDPEVAEWAAGRGASIVWAPGRGLDLAVATGVAKLETLGMAWITVAHADLAMPNHLSTFPHPHGITLVPDRHDDGTNVICLPRGSGFRFSYGKGSFHRHLVEADRLGIGTSILRDGELAHDVDVPADLPDDDRS